MLSISGITQDGKYVISGVHKLVGTYGLPLEDVLIYFTNKNYVIDWLDYILSASKEGASNKTIKSKLLAAASEIYRGDDIINFTKIMDYML